MSVWTNEDELKRLLLQLKSEEGSDRENSAYMIGELAAEAAALAKNTLKSENDLAKINALTQSEVLRSIEKALINATTDEDAWVRGNVIEALGKLGSVEALSSLTSAISDPEYVVRMTAIEAIGMIGDWSTTECLLGLLNDEAWDIRVQAARSLAQLGNPAVIGDLKRLSNDTQEDVRAVVSEAIISLREKQNNAHEKVRITVADS